MHTAGAGHGTEEEQTHSPPCGHWANRKTDKHHCKPGGALQSRWAVTGTPLISGGKAGGANKGSRGRAEASGWREVGGVGRQAGGAVRAGAGTFWPGM